MKICKRLKNCFIVFISFCFFIIQSCTSSKLSNYHFNQKTAAPQLKEDIALLKNILEANHPSLYWYTPKDSIDAAFSNAINSIKDSLTEVEFRNKVAVVISKIRCGHTAVRFSKNYSKEIEKNRYPQFPLFIKTWGDSMVVLGSLLPKDSVFKRGTVITSINHKTNRQLIDSMFQLISTDGYSNNYKSQVFSGNFPVWYKLAFGSDSLYSIDYIDNAGNPKTKVITFYQPKKDTAVKKKDTLKVPPVIATKTPSKREMKKLQLLSKRSMFIDSSLNTAFIRLATFNSGKLRKFYRQNMRTIKQQKIQNVVIDLRENTGGELNKSNLLTKYFINKPFKTGDTVAAISRKFRYLKYFPQGILYWMPMHTFFNRKMSDGRIHNRYLEKHYFHPKKNNHFNGNVYLMQAGYTFSAATIFISNLKGQQNVTVAGEETGGGYYGNSAMFLPDIILPNSKLRVVLPLYRLVMDSTRTKNGHGIIPDVLIEPSSIKIKQGIDIKMERIREIITAKNTKSNAAN